MNTTVVYDKHIQTPCGLWFVRGAFRLSGGAPIRVSALFELDVASEGRLDDVPPGGLGIGGEMIDTNNLAKTKVQDRHRSLPSPKASQEAVKR